jgi:thiol peroxidase
MTPAHTPERPAAVTFRGTPMTLLGPGLRVGEPAPDFRLTDADLGAFTLEEAIDAGSRNALFIVVPSLDTPTCSLETTTFHRRIGEVPAGTAAFVVSLDLPFAQRRWAAANDAGGLSYLSDYRDRSFGNAYGVVLKELGLLTRANFVVAKDRTLAYVEIVAEVANEPNYDATLAALKKLG